MSIKERAKEFMRGQECYQNQEVATTLFGDKMYPESFVYDLVDKIILDERARIINILKASKVCACIDKYVCVVCSAIIEDDEKSLKT